MIRLEKRQVAVILSGLFFLDLFLGVSFFSPQIFSDGLPRVVFFDVGQGDAEMIEMPDGEGGFVRILIDGGRDRKIIDRLSEQTIPTPYIDVVIATHPDYDHYGGLLPLFDVYEAGVFAGNGVMVEKSTYKKLLATAEKKAKQSISLRAGDKIRYREERIDILMPDIQALRAKGTNEAGIVMLYTSGTGRRVLFTADIGKETEKRIIEKYPDLTVDILKVAHHGSRNSSAEVFVKKVAPKVAVIEVGKNNYGHPTSEVLELLASSDALIYRTDLHKTKRIVLDIKP
ncbi:MAG: MBL fold metallo-hydrolase [Candidatus Harrisonbacteria bacterium]|nr:MBL fold metallo-hydrolase [Candidatus Harrisonbacteria bacterium]